jgi:O-antigen/teichoic acid export membrane protein
VKLSLSAARGGRFGTLIVPTLALAASGSTTLGFNIVLARVLEPSQYGELARAFAVAMAVAQLTMASVAPAMTRLVALAPDDPQRFDRAPSGIRVVGACSAIGAVLYVPLAFAGLAPDSALLVLGGISLAVIYATYFGIKMILFALDRIRSYALLEFASDVVFFAFLALFVATKAEAALFAFALAYGLFIVVAWRYIRARAESPTRVPLDRDVARYSALSLVSTYASVARFPFVIAIAGLVGNSIVSARIALVLSLVMPLFLLPQAAGAVTFADVARNPDGDTDRVRQMVRVIGLLSSLLAAFAAILARPLLETIGGSAYGPGATSLMLVLFCLVPQLAAIPIGNAAAAKGGIGIKAAISAFGLVLAVVTAALAVPRFGVIGAAAAVGAGMATAGSLSLAYGFRHFDLRVSDLAGSAVIVAAGVIAVAAPGGIPVAFLIALLGVGAAIAMSWTPRMKQATS